MTGALTPVWNRHVNLNIATTDSHAPDARTLSGTRVNPAVQSPARHGRSIRACSMANEWLGMGEVLCPPRRSHRRRSSVTSWNRSLDDVIGRVMRGTHPRASLHNQCAESDPRRFRLGLADGRGSVFPSAAGGLGPSFASTLRNGVNASPPSFRTAVPTMAGARSAGWRHHRLWISGRMRRSYRLLTCSRSSLPSRGSAAALALLRT